MKKILVLGMIIVMALGVFAGCGQQEQVSEQPAQDQQVQSQENMDSQPEEQRGQNQQGVIYEDGVAMNPDDYELIGEDEARKIALANVEGAKAEDMSRIDLDYDDGHWVYEGEIYQGEWEYEFEIDAENGNVLGFEKDHIYD